MHRNVFEKKKKKNQATMNLRCNSHLYTKLTNTEPKLSPHVTGPARVAKSD